MSSKKKVKTENRQHRTVSKVVEPLMQDGAFLLNAKNPSMAEYVGLGFGLMIYTVFTCFICGTLYSNMNWIKWMCTIVMTGMFVLGLVVALLQSYAQRGKLVGTINKEILLKTFTVPQMFILGYVLFSFISALISPYGSDVWVGQGRYEGFYTILLYSGIFFLTSQFGKYHKLLIYALSCTMIVFSLIAFGQYFGANPFGLFANGYNFRTTLFLSSMGNIDVVSGLLAVTIPILFAAYVLFDGKYRYYLILPAFFLSLFVQMITNVDSGKFGLILAVVVAIPILFTNIKRAKRILELAFAAALSMYWQGAMVVTQNGVDVHVNWTTSFSHSSIYLIVMLLSVIAWLFFYIKETDFTSKNNNGFFAFLQKAHVAVSKISISPKQIRIGLVSAIGGVALIALVFLFTYSGSSEILTQLSHFLHGQLDDMAGSGRGFVWKNTLNLIKENPLFGTGPDTYKEAFMEYSQMFKELYNIPVYFDYAHNDYLQIASNQGLLALICYLGFLVSLCVRAFKNMKYNPLIIIFGLGVVGYTVHVFFSFSIAILAPVFWVTAGLLDNCIRHTPTEEPVNLLDPVNEISE